MLFLILNIACAYNSIISVELTKFRNKNLSFNQTAKMCCDSFASPITDDEKGNLEQYRNFILSNNVSSAGMINPIVVEGKSNGEFDGEFNQYVLKQDSYDKYNKLNNPTNFIMTGRQDTIHAETSACDCDWVPNCDC